MPAAESHELTVNIFDYLSILSDEDPGASLLRLKIGIDSALNTGLSSGITVIITTENLAKQVVNTFNTQISESLPSTPSNSVTKDKGKLSLHQSTTTQRKLLVSVYPGHSVNLFLPERLKHIIDYLTVQKILCSFLLLLSSKQRKFTTD